MPTQQGSADRSVPGRRSAPGRRTDEERSNEQARIKGYPSRLTIRSHGRAVEIGSYLADKERENLALELRQAMLLPGITGQGSMLYQDAAV